MKGIEIAGGGLAGLVLSRSLALEGVPVGLSDSGLLPRHRVCGEFMTGLDRETSRRLGLEARMEACRPLRSTLWFRRGVARFRSQLPQPARSLSRIEFDGALLADAKQAGVQVRENTRLTGSSDAPGLVHATGRPRSGSEWIGLKCHVRDWPLGADLEVHLGHRSYVGLSPVDGPWVNVCGLFPKSALAGGARQDALWTALAATGLTELADRLRDCEVRDGSRCAVAGVEFTHAPRSSSDLLRIGDAAGVIPPFTGHGMAMALQSADTALPELLAWSRGELPWSDASRRIGLNLRRRFSSRMRFAMLVHPLILSQTGQRLLLLMARLRLLPFSGVYRLTHGS